MISKTVTSTRVSLQLLRQTRGHDDYTQLTKDESEDWWLFFTCVKHKETKNDFYIENVQNKWFTVSAYHSEPKEIL